MNQITALWILSDKIIMKVIENITILIQNHIHHVEAISKAVWEVEISIK